MKFSSERSYFFVLDIFILIFIEDSLQNYRRIFMITVVLILIIKIVK